MQGQPNNDDLEIAAVGTDTSGTVSAELADTREVVRFIVLPGWERAIPAESLAAAIMAAYSDGLSKLPELSFSELLADQGITDQSFTAKLQEFGGPPRSAKGYEEDVRNTIDQAALALNYLRLSIKSANATNQFSADTISFRLSQKWVTGCRIDGAWARGKSGQVITTEVARAFNLAKSSPDGTDLIVAAQQQVQKSVYALLSLSYEAIAALAGDSSKCPPKEGL